MEITEQGLDESGTSVIPIYHSYLPFFLALMPKSYICTENPENVLKIPGAFCKENANLPLSSAL